MFADFPASSRDELKKKEKGEGLSDLHKLILEYYLKVGTYLGISSFDDFISTPWIVIEYTADHINELIAQYNTGAPSHKKIKNPLHWHQVYIQLALAESFGDSNKNEDFLS